MKWSYGITTVPSRFSDLFQKSLNGLSEAGFPKPWAFVDGGTNPVIYQSLGLGVTLRYPKVGAFGNWIMSLWELYLRNPHADRYALFQDDILCSKNVRQYLERKPLPAKGYINLFSFLDSNERLLMKDNYGGWVKSDQFGRGALGLVFDREAVQILLSSKSIAEKPRHVKFGDRKIDGAVVTALSPTHRHSDFTEYIHNPSLVQHAGKVSVLGNHNQPLAKTFPGEDFDCLSLLPQPAPCGGEPTSNGLKLGDKVESALSSVGITKDRVASWVGDCNCTERQEKLNALSDWAEGFVKKKFNNVKERLEKILGSN